MKIRIQNNKTILIFALLITVVIVIVIGVKLLNSKKIYEYKCDKEEVTITKCLKNGKGKLVIPEKISGKKVTRLAIESFSKLDYEEIEVPKTVEFIGAKCFSECSKLKKVSGTENVIEYRTMVFYRCTKLLEFSVSDKATQIGSAMFFECHDLKSVYIGDKIERIPTNCFQNCSNLEIVEGMKNIVFIDEYAFCDSGLKEIKLYDKLYSIGPKSFYGTKISSIVIPENTAVLSNKSLNRCRYLESITILSENIIFDYKFIEQCEKLKYLYLPNKTIDMEGVVLN